MKALMILAISFIVILVISSFCMGYIFEEQKITPGNIHGRGDVGEIGFGSISVLPESNFILISQRGSQSEGQLLVFDAEKLQYLGKLSASYLKYFDNAILKVEDGWDVYMIGLNIINPDKCEFIKIHITSDGYIQQVKRILKWEDTNKAPILISNQSHKEIFLLTTKIYRYIPNADSFETISYPEGWPQDLSIAYLFSLEGKNLILIESKQLDSISYLAWWDLDSRSGQTIGQNINLSEVNKWGNEVDKYLCNVGDKIMVFDSNDKSFTILMENLPPHNSRFALDDEGKFLYAIERNDETGSNLVKIDLENKSYEIQTIDYDYQKYLFTAYRWYKIPNKNSIMTELTDPSSSRRWTSLLDLETNKIRFISEPGVLDDTYQNIYLPELDLLILNNQEDRLAIFDPTRETFLQTISFGSNFGYFQSTKDFVGTVSGKGRYFSKLNLEIGKRQISDIGYYFLNWGAYPDSNGIILTKKDPNYLDPESMQYNQPFMYEYSFMSSDTIRFDIPSESSFCYYYSDPLNNQVLAAHFDTPKLIHFIKSKDNYTDWIFPYPDADFSYLPFMDEEMGAFWINYRDDINSNFGFMKLNTNDKTYNDYPLTSINGFLSFWNIYNHGEYILGLNSSIFYIIDPVKDEVKFQTQIYSGSGTIKGPAIVPVHEKDRIFMWDGKMVWQIDVKNMELLNGEVYQNPNQDRQASNAGYYNKNMNEVIFYDSADSKSVLRVDADSGNIIEQISVNIDRKFKRVFDTENLIFYFLEPDTGKITCMRLNDIWDNAPTIKPQGQFVEYRPGDIFKLILDIANPVDAPQEVTAYIWFWLLTGQYIFFGPNGLTTEVAGIPLTLPANLDTSMSIDLFTVPQGMPAGFYNLNAVFFNNRTAVRGPMGTYNFMAGE
jgi:hypothetical protein